MILEQVKCHPERQDMYIDTIITPHDMIKEKDRIIINRILFEEVAMIQMH